MAWGQEQFQLLLQESQSSEAGAGPAEDQSLEELRYRWMLYKSKMKDVGDIRARASAKVSGHQQEQGIQYIELELPITELHHTCSRDHCMFFSIYKKHQLICQHFIISSAPVMQCLSGR